MKTMGIKQVLSAPRSPWQRAYVERVIGTFRRECLDHLIVFNERSLHGHLESFLDYYHRIRVHLALEKDTPRMSREPRTDCPWKPGYGRRSGPGRESEWLPVLRQQFPELGDRVRGDAREHVAEPDERLNSAPFAGSDEAA